MRHLAIPLLLLALALPPAARSAPEGEPVDEHATEKRPAAVRIAGTNVSLPVPAGFEVSGEFPGLGRDDDLTSVLVSQLEMPFERARQDFTAEALGSRGVRLHRTTEVPIAGRTGTLMHATQRANGIEFRKWLLLFGDDRSSVLLTATTPLDLESVHQQALVETLQAARWEPQLANSPTEGLRFVVREVAPLRIVKSAPNAVVLSDPAHDAHRSIAPLVVVGSSLGRVQITDLGGFSRERLRQTVSIEDLELVSESSRHLDGLPAHEVRATARDVSSGRAVQVTQLLATDGERYYLLQGIADAEDAESFEPLLAQVIDSFALRE